MSRTDVAIGCETDAQPRVRCTGDHPAEHTRTSANELARRVITNELTFQDDHTNWMYRLEKEQSGKKWVEEIIETKEGSLSRLLSIDDRPLSAKQQEEENKRVQELMTSRSAKRKLQRELEEATLQGKRLFKMLPDAFVFDYAAELQIKPELIIDESAVNPKYFERMSQLLEALIRERKTKALHYTAYLAKVAELANKVQKPESESSYPQAINTGPRRALYDNLGKDEKLAVRVDTAIRDVKKDGWRGNRFKEREVRAAIKSVLGANDELVNQTFAIVEKQREY